jgi:hypothetical protein
MPANARIAACPLSSSGKRTDNSGPELFFRLPDTGRLSVIIKQDKNPAMDLKETIISSFYFHLILFLLMMAASNYTTGLPGGFQKIISVDLAMEESKDRPEARNDAADEQPPLPGPSSDEGMSLPAPAAVNPPAEPIKIPEPEKKAATEPAKIENAEKAPIQREGFTSLEAYYQFLGLHKKLFGQQAGARVNELLGEAFKTNKREFYGGTAIVSLKFGPDGKVNEVLVDSESPALKAFLEEIGWGALPAPASYSLGSTRVQIEFAVLEGAMSFNITPR